MTAWWAIFCARVDLPIPFGPTRIALVASLRNSSDIRASMAGLSHFFGHAQSKSHSGLKRPICASLRRRSKLRRARSCSSHSMRSWSHPAAVASCQWARRPWRPSALALAWRASRLFIGRPLELVVEFEPGRSDGNVARLDMVGQIGGDGRQLLALMALPLKGERAPHVRVGDGIIIQIETDIWRLAGGDGHPLEQRVGVVGQLHQKMRFRGKGLANTEAVLFGAGSIRRQVVAPDIGLGIEVVQIGKFAGRKEGGANVSNCAFDPAFFISPGDGDRTRIKSIASGKLEQGGMKADDVTLALQHSAFEIIVEDDLWDPRPCLEGRNMTAQKVLQAGIEEEAQEDVARIAQHHDEGHQRTAGAADHKMTEVRPVDLGLLARQTAQTQKGFGLWTRPQARNEMPEVMGAAAVTAFVHHHVQPA